MDALKCNILGETAFVLSCVTPQSVQVTTIPTGNRMPEHQGQVTLSFLCGSFQGYSGEDFQLCSLTNCSVFRVCKLLTEPPL